METKKKLRDMFFGLGLIFLIIYLMGAIGKI